MWCARFTLVLFFALSVACPARTQQQQQSQQPTSSASTLQGTQPGLAPPSQASLPQAGQGIAFLQQALAAQTGGAPVTDVTLTGTATVAIRNQPTTAARGTPLVTQSGTILIKLAAGEQSQVVINLPSGTETDTRTRTNGTSSATAIDTDGTVTNIPAQTALTPHPYVFFPALLLSTGLSSSSSASTYMGTETQNGASVAHVAVWQLPVGTSSPAPQAAALLQRATQHDIYLDPNTLLPISMKFNVHPYDPNNPQRRLLPYKNHPVDYTDEYLFSNYQIVQGRPVAFHIQVYRRGLLIRDIQLTSVTFNTGVTVGGN